MINNKLPFALIQNRDGNWVDANPQSMTAAADSLISEMPSDLKQSITDAPGAAADPISSYSYLLLFKRQGDASKAEAFSKFVRWVLHDGQSTQMIYTTEWYQPPFSQERMTNSSKSKRWLPPPQGNLAKRP